MFPKEDEESLLQNTSSLKKSTNSKIFWHHQDALIFFKKYKKVDTRFIPDHITVSIVSDLVVKYLDNPKLNDPYIDWIFLDFFVYQELAQFALIIKQKIRKFLGLIKNRDYFSSIKLWLKMRAFYELLNPPILVPHFIKLKLIECYDLGARWGEQDNVSPLVYKIAQSNSEYMLVRPL
ncbi:MAG: hypothetical protein IPP67_06770 [Rhodospirillaceae bacterium]|nr:hypothetical protein [Rhodospirillaceae bacterium]